MADLTDTAQGKGFLSSSMDEDRKRMLVTAAAIIASRRLSQLDFKPSPLAQTH